MTVTPLALPEVLLIEPVVHADARGHFLETWQASRYADAGIDVEFVQDNRSFSRAGVLRGLHYQWPNPQGKLVSVTAGRIFDVAVDVRRDSPRFGQWVGEELSAANHRQLWIPPGFAHGFAVVGDSAVVAYKVSGRYDRASEVTIRYDDPALAIAWPVTDPIVAEKDAAGRRLAEVPLDRLPVVSA
jgi:dTDP-4-dehydrorhamnose 3,5-epimerase